MGFFSNVFRPSSDLEKELEQSYVPMFQATMGMSLSQAQSTFHDLLKQVREEAQMRDIQNLPQNFGDTLLQEESSNEKYKDFIAKKRSEGVNNEDIRWWWNMDNLEKGLLVKIDEMNQLALFAKHRESGLTAEEAAKLGRKSHPFYGDPDDVTYVKGDDRALPYELKNRVNIFIEKRSKDNQEKFKKEIEGSSTFNALVRQEIKNGTI